MRLLSVNCNGVASKKAELENLISYTQPNILCLTETKLDDSVYTSEFLPKGYSGFRKDRVKGGGWVVVKGRRVSRTAKPAAIVLSRSRPKKSGLAEFKPSRKIWLSRRKKSGLNAA